MKKKKKINTIHTVYVNFEYDDRLIGKSSKTKIYRNATLLSPGTFSDSITMSPVKYSKDVLKKTYNNWKSNYLNLDHSHHVLDRIGRVMNPHFSDGAVKGDLYIYPITENAKDTIKLIDSKLINWLSVEIRTLDMWDLDDERYVDDIEYLGVAVVSEPACKEALIDEDGPSPPSFMYDD